MVKVTVGENSSAKKLGLALIYLEISFWFHIKDGIYYFESESGQELRSTYRTVIGKEYQDPRR